MGLKFLQRPPRGNAVREHHGLPNLKTVQFAEQVTAWLGCLGTLGLGGLGIPLSCRELARPGG